MIVTVTQRRHVFQLQFLLNACTTSSLFAGLSFIKFTLLGWQCYWVYVSNFGAGLGSYSCNWAPAVDSPLSAVSHSSSYTSRESVRRHGPRHCAKPHPVTPVYVCVGSSRYVIAAKSNPMSALVFPASDYSTAEPTQEHGTNRMSSIIGSLACVHSVHTAAWQPRTNDTLSVKNKAPYFCPQLRQIFYRFSEFFHYQTQSLLRLQQSHH